MGRTAPLTSKRFILYIYSTNIGTEYFKHALYSQSFSLQNAVCFIMLTCLVHVLFTFYIQDVLNLKKNNSGAERLIKALSFILLLLFAGSAGVWKSAKCHPLSITPGSIHVPILTRSYPSVITSLQRCKAHLCLSNQLQHF